MSACVRACSCVRGRACEVVRACMRSCVCVCARARMCVRMCVHPCASHCLSVSVGASLYSSLSLCLLSMSLSLHVSVCLRLRLGFSCLVFSFSTSGFKTDPLSCMDLERLKRLDEQRINKLYPLL